MKRIGLCLLLCALFDAAAAGGGWSFSTRFLESITVEDVANGRLPARLEHHHGIYPLLVWLRLSGRYTAEHEALFQAYLDGSSREDTEAERYDEDDFVDVLESDGHVVGELNIHRLLERHDERDGESIVTSSWMNNCRPDAFATAYATYVDRRARHGLGSAALDRWVEAQVAVFRQCAEDEGDPPEEPDPRWQPLDRHDRLYQIAAWHFYRQSYLEAAGRFGSIAENGDSPWQALARYLVPRSLARQAIVNESVSWQGRTGTQSPERLQLLREALDGFEALAADDAYLAEFPSVMYQIMRIQVELDDSSFAGAFERRLIERPASVDPLEIDNYNYLAKRWHDATGRPEEYGRWLRHVVAVADNFAHDLYYGVVESAVDDLVEAWRAERSLPYLYLALGFAHENIAPADLRGLLVQFRNQTPDTPGYLAMLGQRLRVARMLDDDAAVSELKQELAEQMMRVSSIGANNRIRLQLALGASDWREYVQWSALLPLNLPWTDAYARRLSTDLFHRITSESRLFPIAATNVINIFATPDTILDVLDAPGLSDYQRSRLANAGWVRALLADDLVTAVELAPRVGQFSPLLAEEMEGFAAAEDKHFEAAWIVLRHPGLSPWLRSGIGRTNLDSGRHLPASDRIAVTMSFYNWWCGAVGYSTRGLAESLPYFIRDTDLDNLDRPDFPTAAEFFGPHVIRYARENRTDPRIPQALHRVVFATRYSCSSGPGDVSQGAHEILHRHYADSEWTEKTPHWYE